MFAICTPTRDSTSIEFAFSLANLMQQHKDCVFAYAKGVFIDDLRNLLAGRALLQKPLTHVLWIDSDMEFPVSTARRLLAHNLDFVGCNCAQRANPTNTTAFKNGVFIKSQGRSGVEQVDSLGMGITLVKLGVFMEVPPPWFSRPWDAATRKHLGEDAYFSGKARMAGYKIWIDHDLSIEVKHAGLVVT